ncbi:hypothetical protein D3C73_833580 [compost metagenome]
MSWRSIKHMPEPFSGFSIVAFIKQQLRQIKRNLPPHLLIGSQGNQKFPRFLQLSRFI